MSRTLDVASSVVASFTRRGAGRHVVRLRGRAAEPVLLFDVEGCPYCRPVREALTMVDVDAQIRPVPHEATRFAADLAGRTELAAVPFLVDPNTGFSHGEADHIVQYLFREYADDDLPPVLRDALARMSSTVASAARPGRGTTARPSRAPETPLVLWSFEACPYCRLVREVLTELETPYLLRNMGKGSTKREAFRAHTGRLQFPYLEDPNTGTALFESADIVRYLVTTYGA